MRKAYAFIGAAAAWFGLIGQFFLSNGTKLGPTLAEGTINYFSYFTILSNILVAIAFTAVAFAPDSRLGRFFGNSNGATPVAVYITVTGIVYWFLLRPLYELKGLAAVLNAIHHYAMPVAFVLFWLIFVPKGRLRLRDMPDWLVFPLVYALYTLLHGQASGFYPYPFVDVGKLGLDHVLRNMGRLVIFFALVSAVFVLVDRLLGRLRRVPQQPAEETVAPVAIAVAVPVAAPAPMAEPLPVEAPVVIAVPEAEAAPAPEPVAAAAEPVIVVAEPAEKPKAETLSVPIAPL